MKRLFKWLFSTKSKSKKYFPEILLLVYLAVSTMIGIIIVNLFKINNIFTTIYAYFILIQWILFLIPCTVRIINVSDYKDGKKIKNGKMKFNFKPILYNIKDVKKWVYISNEPDVIYIKSKNEKIIALEVSFETKGRNGPFINKKIYFDDVEIKVEELEKTILDKCIILNNCVYIVAITEYNNPKYFNKILDNLNK